MIDFNKVEQLRKRTDWLTFNRKNVNLSMTLFANRIWLPYRTYCSYVKWDRKPFSKNVDWLLDRIIRTLNTNMVINWFTINLLTEVKKEDLLIK